MIKELNKSYSPNWNERIEISLTLKDLQLIYDCVGAVPKKYLDYKHETSRFKKEYDAPYFTALYNELDEILNFHNGITDESVEINTDIELNMIGGE